jgi:tRNA (guanosine-2'-O-)-methyltransferase
MGYLTPSRKQELIAQLSAFVTEKRLARMHGVLAQRTRHITVAVEDIYQPHNASAVLRTCDAFGVQDVHIIENRNAYRINPGVELGAAQWLSMHRYRDGTGAPESRPHTEAAFAELRSRGYRIAATLPRADAIALEELDPVAQPLALVFGNEPDGLSDTAVDQADLFVHIPMFGFVESFNISVAAAISLHQLTHRLRASTREWRLPPDEKDEILLGWLRSSVKRSAEIERQLAEQAQAERDRPGLEDHRG